MKKDVTRLIQEDHVVGIIGSLHSGNINATVQIVEDAKIPEVGPGLAMSWLQQGWTYLFRSVGNTECSNTTLLQFCVDKGWHNIAVFNAQDDYGTDTGDVFVEYAKNYDVEIVTRESFNPQDSDFTGQAAKIVKAQPDAVMVIAVQNDAGSVIKQLRLAGYEGPSLVTAPWATWKLRKLPALPRTTATSAHSISFRLPLRKKPTKL